MPKILLNKSNVDLDYPICRPSLDLDFTQEVLDERITFSRGSIGTRVNRNRLIETVPANQPRFDYDTVTGECKGLLIEESRQNLLTYSEQFDNAAWDKLNAGIALVPVVTANNVVSPTGELTADKVVFNISGGTTSGEYSFLSQPYSSVSGTSYTISAWVRVDSGTSSIFIDCESQNVNIVQVTTSWQRFNFTRTSSSTASKTVRIGLRGNVATSKFATIYIWGAQLEAGSFPTSYIPTTASTVTRNADLANMTGTNFSSWYNQTEGTFYISGNASYVFQRSFGASIFNNAAFADNRISIRMGNTFIRAGADQFAVYPQASRDKWKLSFGLKQNDATFALDGSQFATDKNVRLPTNLDILEFGKVENVSSGLFLNGTLNRFTYYPRRLKDNQLVLLTQ